MDKNITENNYGSIYKTTGGGNESFKVKPHRWVKKILGNRVFDLYIKYLGVKTLTTFTLVPLDFISFSNNFKSALNLSSEKIPFAFTSNFKIVSAINGGLM